MLSLVLGPSEFGCLISFAQVLLSEVASLSLFNLLFVS